MRNQGLFKVLPLLLFLMSLILIVWRIIIGFDLLEQGDNGEFWADAYFLVALYGGCAGVFISRYWGGLKSLLGKAITAFSVGLFLQSFGQGVYTYYALFKGVEAAYPSIGDIGFFGSIPAYILGVFWLAKVVGVRFSLRSVKSQAAGVIIPIFILACSYFFFLRDYEFDGASYLAVFLDFAYPLGQATYLSVAALVMLLSLNYLGGTMKKPLFLLLFALFVQYLSDFVFLYRFNQDLYVAGGITDILYFIAYFFMGFSLIYIGVVFRRISSNV